MLSFEHTEDHTLIDPIEFNNDLSILIGPNGSGKSNFLEVINKLFTNILIKECIFNEQNLKDYDRGGINISLNNTLSERPYQNNYLLPKNRHSNLDKKMIKVTISLSEDDKNNLTFIYQNIQDLNNYSQKYSSNVFIFNNEGFREDELSSIKDVTFTFINENKNSSIFSLSGQLGKMNTFVYLYLNSFILFRI